ncbi:MAG: (d)CMP kinase [Leptospiraceae bacterium]|nr:(d)CMP kinase [Leptospiraceae bacterium]MDW7976463.1 (d)CMP kinase [Leptospiraceae bacterium]
MGIPNKLEKVITLDGPAGSGKSTIAKRLAEKIGYLHLDSGAIYRAFTYAVIDKIGEQESIEIFERKFLELQPHPHEFPLQVMIENHQQVIYYKEKKLQEELRTYNLTQRIKFIADDVRYRSQVNQILRSLGSSYLVVVDGRDMGTEVFPEAKFKFYLDASVEIRAQRRYQEYHQYAKAKGMVLNMDLEKIKNEIALRDHQDQSRKFGALRIPHDAILIDTSNLTINMVLSIILSCLQKQF